MKIMGKYFIILYFENYKNKFYKFIFVLLVRNYVKKNFFNMYYGMKI